MDQCPGRRPEIDQETRDQKTLCDYDHGDIESTRTQYHQPGPRIEETLQRLPTTWPQCLGRGAPICSSQPPLPLPLPPPLIHQSPHPWNLWLNQSQNMRLQFPQTCLLTLSRQCIYLYIYLDWLWSWLILSFKFFFNFHFILVWGLTLTIVTFSFLSLPLFTLTCGSIPW